MSEEEIKAEIKRIYKLPPVKEEEQDEKDQYALEFFDYMENERWRFDHKEQKTHTVREHLFYFKQIRKP